MLAQGIHALSFDVEDWYQSCMDLDAPITKRVYKNTKELFQMMEHFQIRSTLFILGKVAEAFPELVKEAVQGGHEIATHGYSHKNVFDLGPVEFERELKKSIALLEEIGGEKVLGHRAPNFSIRKENFWAFEIMQNCGLQYDSSIFPIRGRRYGIPEAPRFPYVFQKKEEKDFWEVPLSTIQMGKKNFPMAGGGYIRHFPLWFTRWAIDKLEKKKKNAILYFHPYEIDVKESILLRKNMPWKEKFFTFRQGLFRSTMKEKLLSLFKSYRLAPIREVLGL